MEGTMKKLIFLFILILLLNTLYSNESVQIKDINPPETLKGADFFPLFVGAKWEWNVKGMGDFTKITWEIISAHIINDATYNIYNTTAFKLKATFKFDEKEMTDEWHILEYNGFICFYKKSRDNYYIEKILPVKPDIQANWVNESNKFKIAEISNNSVKVELTNEELARYGYQIFVKNVGPYEIFEYLTIGDKKQEIIMSLINNVSYKDVLTVKKEEIPGTEKKEESITKTTNIDTYQEKNNLEISKEDYINYLSADKKYLQIGSFTVIFYAEELALKSKKAEFTPKIFLDKDGQYKVLIEFSIERSIMEKEIKNKLGLDPFLKK